jgi:hypothetical protein
MADPTDLQRFIAYAQAFEVAFWSDGWDGIAPFFADGARHLVHGAAPLGCDDRGRDAVVRGLRESVSMMDRRFDVRIPEVLEGPLVRGGADPGIWMRYSLALRRKGLPELRFEGTHMARYDAQGLIREIEEQVEAGAGERVAAYLARHDAALRPAGSAAAPPSDPRDAADAEAAMQRSLARAAAAVNAHA